MITMETKTTNTTKTPEDISREAAWKAVLLTVASCVVLAMGLLIKVQTDTMHRLLELQREDHETIDKLRSELTQLQFSYLGHVRDQADFQQALKEGAAGRSEWWAYVRMHRAQERARKKKATDDTQN